MTTEATGRRDAGAHRRGETGRRGVTSFGLFWLAFLSLVGSVVAIAFAQFRVSHPAPWISMGLSAAAVVLSAVAVLVRHR